MTEWMLVVKNWFVFCLRLEYILDDEKRMLLKDVTVLDAGLSYHNALLTSFVLR